MKVFHKYYQSFQLSIKSAMEYRIDFLLNIFGGIFTIIVQSSLWTAIFNNTSEKLVYGYTYSQMITYVFMAGIISKFISAGFERQISNDIKSGTLSKFIIQPINYLLYRLFVFGGRKVVQSISVFLITVILIVLGNSVFSFNLQIINLVVAVIPLTLAVLLNFFIYYCISSIAFWMTDVFVLFFGINVITSVLSGGYFPIDIFDTTFLKIINCLPFKYTTYFPLNIIIGKIQGKDIFIGIIIQSLWIIGLIFGAKIIWKFGMKKYIAAGG